ncbi:MAG: ETC complex I subunit [Rhodospirillaceae bacterium]|nr:ETC complex I subunit [Rhodospirillaceae bacterium]
MSARIYKPAKTAMQSGRGNTRDWVLEFSPAQRKTQDPLMGWTGSGDTPQQVKLTFDTKEEAIAYCRRHKLDYDVFEPKERSLRPKSYANNFRWDRVS